MSELVEVVNAGKSYRVGSGSVRGLVGFSLSLSEGEMVALVGVSGSGKSTLLHALGGMLRLDSGVLRVAGIDVGVLDGDALARYRRQTVALVFQEYNLLPMLTAEENVAFARMLTGVAEMDARDSARDALSTMGLSAEAARYPAQLSGGQRQRVAVARALAAQGAEGKRLLLADEPSGSLDTETTHDVVAALRRAAEGGLTVLVATHDPLVVAGCDRVVGIRDGANAVESVAA